MQLCAYAKAFEGDTAVQIVAAAAAGFEGVELRGDVDGVPLGMLDLRRFKTLCALADGQGAPIATLALGMLERLVTDFDSLRRVGELAAVAGARVRLFSSGRPGVRSGPEAAGEPEPGLLEAEAERLGACLEALYETAPPGAAMLEAEPYSIANTTARQLRLFEAVGGADIGFNWDFANCWMAGEHPWPEPWPRLAGRLRGIHYKGAKAEPTAPATYASQALPGEDDLPHQAIWSALAATGFEGPVSVDPHYGHFAPRDRFVTEPANPEAEICRRSLEVMRELRRRATEG